MSPSKKRWIAGLSAAALIALAGFALAQDQPPISAPPGYAPAPPPPPNAPPPAQSLEPGDLPTESDNAQSPGASTNEDTGLAPALGAEGDSTPGNTEDQGGGLPQMRGSTAEDQPMDIGVTPPAPPADQTPPAANPDIGLTPDTAPGDVLAPPAAQPAPAAPETAHAPLPRAPAEPGGEVAVLRGLDKISARVTVVDAPIGKPVMFGRLRIVADYCHKRPPELPPEVTAFVRIDDTRVKDPAKARIFSGWMYASSPALHAVEHPVYDVWLTDCKTSTPESEFGSLPKEPSPKEDSTKRSQ